MNLTSSELVLRGRIEAVGQRCGIRLPGWMGKRTVWLLILAAMLLGVGLLLRFRYGQALIAEAVFALSALLAGQDIFRRARRALRSLRLEMNFLMTIAAIGAFGIGHGEEGAAVLFLFGIAETLESYAEDRARASIGKLLELGPPVPVCGGFSGETDERGR